MPVFHSPPTVAPPVGAYTHAVEVGPGARTLFVSGQIGAGPDGAVGATIEDQADHAWRNLLAILAHAGMAPTDLVKTTTYLVSRDDLDAARAARQRAIGDHRPASTLVIVAGLVSPALRIELEAVAVRGG
ncbi:MAG: RidA family protein [Myxococcota bacterium]